MKKVKVFILSFIFLITFLWTFPTKYLVSFILSSNGFLFSRIDGNFLNLKIEDLENKYVYVKNLSITNRLIYQEIKIKKNLKITYKPFVKNLFLEFNRFDTDMFVKDKNIVSAKLDGRLKVFKKGDFKILEGDGKVILRKISIANLNGLRLEYNIRKNKDYSEIEAKLRGININGEFKGKIVWEDKFNIDGTFTGRFLGQTVNRNINEKFEIKFLNGLL
ncbi:MAG: hypothetical protein DSY59_05915 [Persephonella sp.]|nr:MAG: hypothetical protein DSY59_05915 [Persephonella sp.]